MRSQIRSIHDYILSDQMMRKFVHDCMNELVLRAGRERQPTLTIAVKRFMERYEDHETPDGVKYTSTNVRLTFKELF